MFGPLDFLDELFGDAAEVLGWTWEKVITGIFTWFAKGVLLLMEWVFGQIDAATTPRLTDDWFANGLVREVALIGLAITVMMMLISAIQMGWAGRPELFGDAIRNGAKSILGSALVVVLIDGALQMADALTATIWVSGRDDVLSLLDGSALAITDGAEVVGLTFLGPFLILIGMIGFLLITGVLFFRSVMIYLVAAFAPIPLGLAAGTTFRGATRRVVSLTLALVLAKPAVVLTLVVGAKVTSNAGTDTGVAEGLGALVTGFLVFLIAAFAPILIFKLLPMVGDATMTSGVVAGMGRSAMTVAQAGMLAVSVGGAAAGSAATRSVSGQASASSGGTQPSRGSSGSGGLSGTQMAVLPMGGADASSSAATGGPSVGGASGSPMPGAGDSGSSRLGNGWSVANQASSDQSGSGDAERSAGDGGDGGGGR